MPVKKIPVGLLLFFCGLALILLLDRLLKVIAWQGEEGKSFFRPLLNQGIGFSLPFNNWLAVALNFFIISIFSAAFYLFYRQDRWREVAALCLVIGGALSNLIDRLWCQCVIDYIALPLLPIFNLADVLILIGLLSLLLIIYYPSSHTLSNRQSFSRQRDK